MRRTIGPATAQWLLDKIETQHKDAVYCCREEEAQELKAAMQELMTIALERKVGAPLPMTVRNPIREAAARDQCALELIALSLDRLVQIAEYYIELRGGVIPPR